MIERLHETIEAVCPILGVFGSNPTNAGFQSKPEATAPQITAANTALAAFDWSQNAHNLWLAQKKLATVGIVNKRRLPNPVSTILNPAWANATGVGYQLLPNKHYSFSVNGFYNTAAAGTGLQLALNGPPNPNVFNAAIFIIEGAAAIRNGCVNAYDVGVLGTGSAATTALAFWLYGNISTGTQGGNLQLRFRSEVAGSQVTILAGTEFSLEVIEV